MAIRIGDLGIAVSAMSPSGAVEVDGKRLDARSDGPFIPLGSVVVVLRGDPTGYVVRALEPGQEPPQLPGHGTPIPRAEFQRTSAEVAEVERAVRAEKRKRIRQGLRFGGIAAGSLGAFVGLASSGAGWLLGWAPADDPASGAMLLGGALVVGTATGVALFLLTGLIGSVLGMFEGEPGFAPDFSVTAAALMGTAVGFWWHFRTGNPGTIAAWAVGATFVCAIAAYLVKWLVGLLLGSVVES